MSRNLFIVVSHGCSVQVTSKTQVNFRFCTNSRVLTIGSYGFSKFLHSLRYPGQGIYFSQFHEATMFGWPRKSRSTSGFGGTLGYCQLGLMDFSNFFIPYVCSVSCWRGRWSRSDFWFCMNSRVLTIGCVDVISSLFTFSRSRNLFPAASRSYHVRVTLENPGLLPVSEIL